jgi:hypothetical protein
MIPIFESILPIFLIVLLGAALRRANVIDQSVWPGLEILGYYVLFPTLLFLTLGRADFAGLELGTVAVVSLLAMAVMTVLLVLTIYPLGRLRGLSDASYTSVFQTSSRWNAFIGLAIAEKISGPEGLALMALVMAVIVIPLNLINVAMLVWFSAGKRSLSDLVRRIVGNPMILGCRAGNRGQSCARRDLSADRTGDRPDRPLLARHGAFDGWRGIEDFRCAAARPGGAAADSAQAGGLSGHHDCAGARIWSRGRDIDNPCAVRRRARGDERLSAGAADGRRCTALCRCGDACRPPPRS